MSKYVYAAVFTKEKDGKYSVTFNDVKGCYTCGDSLNDAVEMAEDALALVLYEYETEGREIPKATDISKIKTGKDEFATYIACDTLEYRKMHNNKAVKKTLTIPAWLNAEATAAGINFSAALQEILQEKLFSN